MKGQGKFMNGLEISKQFYLEFGAAAIKEKAPHLEHLLAVGLCGSGSECYGFDDEISRDHDFEPGFCVFVPSETDRKDVFLLERAYASLPKEFMGLKRSLVSPVGGSRHGVILLEDFFMQKAGTPNGEMSLFDWCKIEMSALFEAVNGEIFVDNLGEVTSIREKLKNMPEDARLKRLASNLLICAQSGQYNYSRLIMRGENGAAQLALFEFVKAAVNVAFLLEKKFPPYYKWVFKAMENLKTFSKIKEPLEFLISTENSEEMVPFKTQIIQDISALFAEELKRQGITKASCTDLEQHAYSVNDFISDSSLRNEHILFCV